MLTHWLREFHAQRLPDAIIHAGDRGRKNILAREGPGLSGARPIETQVLRAKIELPVFVGAIRLRHQELVPADPQLHSRRSLHCLAYQSRQRRAESLGRVTRVGRRFQTRAQSRIYGQESWSRELVKRAARVIVTGDLIPQNSGPEFSYLFDLSAVTFISFADFQRFEVHKVR